MTWHHVVIVLIAATFIVGVIVACAGRPGCDNIIDRSCQLSLVIISATLGHASRGEKPAAAAVRPRP